MSPFSRLRNWPVNPTLRYLPRTEEASLACVVPASLRGRAFDRCHDYETVRGILARWPSRQGCLLFLVAP